MYRERKCYKCKEELSFNEFIKRLFPLSNLFNFNTLFNDIINIWESEYIELLCCECYGDFEESIKNKKKKDLKRIVFRY